MEKSEILSLLKADLGEPVASPQRAIFLTHIIDVAIERLKDNGIAFSDTYTIAEGGLIRDYARFLITDRETQNGIPAYLKRAIHNRLIEQGKDNAR